VEHGPGQAAADAALPCGVLLVATGEGYRRLAARAAESVRRACPGLPIDLFTDADASGPFDRVVTIEDVWFRSRIEAMARTRFERTLMLDADLLVIADIGDLFEVLDRFDIALAHDQARNGPAANVFWRRPLPNAFPQFNGGVIAYRRSPRVLAFLERWAEAMRTSGLKRDQPVLRELLWESDLRIATLPPEYNLMDFAEIATWGALRTAPRVLHHYKLHKHFTGRRQEVTRLVDLVGPRAAARLPVLLAADRPLARISGRAERKPKPWTWLYAELAALTLMPGFWFRRLRHELLRLVGRR
jgi:Nucleotide-diphospho-sugar transferase